MSKNKSKKIVVDATNDETKNVNIARVQNKHFTIVELCRENELCPKRARRRMRDAIKRNDERVINARKRNVHDDARLKHEFVDTKKNRDLILSIITNQ